MRKGKFDWERANWTRSRNYIFLEIEFEVDLAPLEGAAWSWHAAHVARHHPAVVAAAREHRALVPGGMWQRWWGEGLAVWKVSLANTSPEAAIHARVKRDLVTGPLLSFNVVPEEDFDLIYVDGSGDFIWTWEALDILYFGAPGLWVLPDFGALVPDDQFVGDFPAKVSL